MTMLSRSTRARSWQRGALLTVAGCGALLANACVAEEESLGEAQQAMAPPWDFPPDDPPPSCSVQSEAIYPADGGLAGPPGTIRILSTQDAGDATPFGQWRVAQWAALLGQYQASGCYDAPARLLYCSWQSGGATRCSFRMMTPFPPECTTTSPCTGPNEQCLAGECVEVCPDPCAGKCGTVTACGQSYACGDYCAQGSCFEPTNTCQPDCSPSFPEGCLTGLCSPVTLRCEPECTSNAQCPDLSEACDTDFFRCVPACSPGDEPPGPRYDCVNGIWRYACDAENPCPSISQECRDGYCHTSRCGEGGTCPEGRRCTSDNTCVPNCHGVHCPSNHTCDPATGQCVPFDPCENVTCTGTDVCENGICVPQPCANCYPPNLCVNGVCTFDPCASVVCNPGETCEHGVCVPTGCTWDFDCAIGEICSFGQCIPDEGGEGCVLDGQCTAGETCACDAFCCGGGGGPGPGGGGGGCGYDGGGEITYEQCFACGGTVVWDGPMPMCEIMQLD